MKKNKELPEIEIPDDIEQALQGDDDEILNLKFKRKEAREIVRKIKNIPNEEFIFIENESQGLRFQASSKKYDVQQLLSFGLATFKKLSKKIKQIPTYIQ